MRIAILGYGDQGKSAYEYWHHAGNELTICDANHNIELPAGASGRLGPAYLRGLDEFDLIVRSPSIHPSDIISANSAAILDKVTSNTNEFFKVCPSKNIVGVTGTKGKGTTATLIAQMLKAALRQGSGSKSGKRVHFGGNIGTPPLEMLKQKIRPDDWVILELANFQLIDLKYSPKVAVCLMVVPEHMDWHADVGEYIAAKQQLFRWQKADDMAIYFSDSTAPRQVVSVSHGRKIPYFQKPGAEVLDGFISIGGHNICRTSDLKLLGEHNWQNACAAVTAVWQIMPKPSPIKKILTSFSGLEHRLELVRELKNIKYYDDSFGTTPETAIVAIQAFNQPKVLILGGSDKGADFTNLAKAVVSENVREVIIIGLMGPKIARELEKLGYKNITQGGDNMEQIAKTAQRLAQPGDVVLLSTACASFDMFDNYKDRGEQYKQAVKAL